MRRILVLPLGLMILACGGPSSEPLSIPGEPMVPSAPAPAAPAVPVAAASFPATTEGVCQLQRSCGCTTESYEACLAGDYPPEVAACIVQNDCTVFCAGAGLRCIEEHYARKAADSQLGHELNMGIINNFPTGGLCASGQQEIRDASGNFLRCQ